MRQDTGIGGGWRMYAGGWFILAALMAMYLGCDSSSPDDGGQGSEPPTVERAATYPVQESTAVYGQGLQHSEWGGGTTTPIDLLVDVYEPIGAPAGRPVVLMIHGGAFIGGTRTQAEIVAFARYFAERGWVAFSIDYRLLADRGTLSAEWESHIQATVPTFGQPLAFALYPAARDAKAAVRWIRANASTYQLDTDYITAIGGSAGSYLAVMLGTSEPGDFQAELTVAEDPTLATTNLSESSAVATVIDHWGAATHVTLLAEIDGRSRFDASDAPVSIVHGTADLIVPYTLAEELRDAYIATGVPYAFHPLAGAAHSPWSATVAGQTLQELAMSFIVEQQQLIVAD